MERRTTGVRENDTYGWKRDMRGRRERKRRRGKTMMREK
jgi:hypothetical protein